MTKKQPILMIQGNQAGITDKQGRHMKMHYKVVRKDSADGKITLELIPKTMKEAKRKKLIEELSERLKDSVDNKLLMEDVLTDITLESLEKMDKALKRGATVKPKEGCFFLEIKDPRRKKAMNLQIRK
jgi:hypothetical protein